MFWNIIAFIICSFPDFKEIEQHIHSARIKCSLLKFGFLFFVLGTKNIIESIILENFLSTHCIAFALCAVEMDDISR